MSFCPICGDPAVDTFCKEHLQEKEPLLLPHKPVQLTLCSTCDSFLYRGRWSPLTLFDTFIHKQLVYNPRAVIETVEFPMPIFEEKPKEFTLPLLVIGSVSSAVASYEEEYEIEIPIHLEQCSKCKQATGGYFEGILQIRNPREEVIAFVEEWVSRHPDMRISRKKEISTGIDFEVTNQQMLVTLGHELHRRFGGLIQKNAKLHTYDHQKSKKVYRLTVLVRLPLFWVGSILETRKRLVRVTKMGSTLHVFDIRRRKGSALVCPFDDEVEELTPQEVVISSNQPNMNILDPQTYQEVPLAVPVDKYPGESILVVQDARHAWYAIEDFS